MREARLPGLFNPVCSVQLSMQFFSRSGFILEMPYRVKYCCKLSFIFGNMLLHYERVELSLKKH